MPNTYTQLYIQVVFAVKYRESVIADEWKKDLYNYIIAIIQNCNHKVIAINGVQDHIHIFFSAKPDQSLSDLIQKVKASSSKWVNEKKLTNKRFRWQEGYGAFSYSQSHVSAVAAYIHNQEVHHRNKSMLKEYKAFLQKFDVDYNEAYIFHDPI